MALKRYQLPAFTDNYIYLLEDSTTGEFAVVDPGEATPVLHFLKSQNKSLNKILITHHHHDHIGGIQKLKASFSCSVVAPFYDQQRILLVDQWVKEGDEVVFGHSVAKTLFLPGHTRGHIAYYFENEKMLFSGDVLFSMGCGRLFEGTAVQAFNSLQKIKSLPETTEICCTHEYTKANAVFALTVEPKNKKLQDRCSEVENLRAHEQATVPVLLKTEIQTNPFLRWDSPEIRENLNLQAASDLEIFTELRLRKDHF